MKRLYIAGNWKMNLVPSEASVLAKKLALETNNSNNKIMIAPSFVCLPSVVEAVKGSNIIAAAQNVNENNNGAYTGEVSCSMLKDIGVSTVILGHSERRQYYCETNELINKKVLFALENEFDIVLCVGETLIEREAGKLEDILTEQLNVGLKDVSASQMNKITLAYEPVWAIGTGKTATPEDANNAHAFIRQVLESMFSEEIAESTSILYGGSVKSSNADELMAKENIDGALVGGASLTLEQFLPIINCVK